MERIIHRLPTEVLYCSIKMKRNQSMQPKTWIDNVEDRSERYEEDYVELP